MQNIQQLLYKFEALSAHSQKSLLTYLNDLWQKEKQDRTIKKRGV